MSTQYPQDARRASTPSTAAAGSPASAASAAGNEVQAIAGEGTAGARQTARTAATEARNVAHEAGNQARNLLGQLGSNLRDQAGTQQQRIAEGLRTISDELRSMAQKSAQSGPASDLVQQAARRTGSAADWFEARDPGSLLNEARGFARRRSGAFLALAAGAGLLAGRLTRSAEGPWQEPAGPRPSRAAVPSRTAVPSRPSRGTAAGPASGTASLPAAAGTSTEPFTSEPTIPPGTPPQSTDPNGGRLPLL